MLSNSSHAIHSGLSELVDALTAAVVKLNPADVFALVISAFNVLYTPCTDVLSICHKLPLLSTVSLFRFRVSDNGIYTP